MHNKSMPVKTNDESKKKKKALKQETAASLINAA